MKEGEVKIPVSFSVNGRRVSVEVSPTETLVEVLRGKLLLKGAKEGCRVGECGACTVIVDGAPVLGCLYLAGKLEGKSVETIEGLEKDGELHPLEEAFLEEDAVACGFCTPGMVMSAKALLERNPHPTDGEIRRAISGNLCRCTGYIPIVNAIRRASNMQVKKWIKERKHRGLLGKPGSPPPRRRPSH